MPKLWVDFVAACVSGRGPWVESGHFELPETKFIRLAEQDVRVHVELVSLVAEDLMQRRNRRPLQSSNEWMMTRAELAVLRQLGDELYYEPFQTWFEQNTRQLLCQDKSHALGRHALQILASWEEPCVTRVGFWFELLSNRFLHGTQVPLSWKEIALHGLITADAILAARRVVYWPIWAPSRFEQALLRVWRMPSARQEMISAIYEGKYSPYREHAEEIHIILSDILDRTDNQELTDELNRLHECSDPFRDTAPTNPPPAMP